VARRIESSNKIFKPIEVNVDTVYLRWDEEQILDSNNELIGFKYDEEQYSIKVFIETLSSKEDVGMLSMMISMLMGEIDTLNNKINKLGDN